MIQFACLKKKIFSFRVFSYKPGSEQTGFCAPSLLRVISFRLCSPTMHCSRWFMLSKRLLWSCRYFSLYSAPWRYKRPESIDQWVNTQLSNCDLHYSSTFWGSIIITKKFILLFSRDALVQMLHGSISMKGCSFEPSHQQILKICIMVFIKIKPHNCFQHW